MNALLISRRTILLMLAALCCSGCSSFNREWKRSLQAGASEHAVAGAWEGAWLSDRNGHTGKLRCILTEDEPARYTARFKATYWKIFRIRYRIHLEIQPEPDGGYRLSGEEDLGWWGGGVYQYEGEIRGTQFQSTYRSKYDHGVFRMSRVP